MQRKFTLEGWRTVVFQRPLRVIGIGIGYALAGAAGVWLGDGDLRKFVIGTALGTLIAGYSIFGGK